MKDLGGMKKMKGIPLKGGAGGMIHGQAHTGKQAPGVTGTTKSGGNKNFKADAGGSMHGKQSVQPVVPGQTGKGGKAGGAGGGAKRKGSGQNDRGDAV